MKLVRLALLTSMLAVGASRAAAQRDAATKRPKDTELLRVFVDCDAQACDSEFFRTDITFVNLVRDRQVSQVHILVTQLETGSGGVEFTLQFMGREDKSAIADTLKFVAKPTDTIDERRRGLSRIIKQGLLRFVRGTEVGNRLDITYPEPPGASRSASRGARDRWGGWVYRIGSNGFFNGDANYKSSNAFGSLNADRVTASFKVNLSLSANYSDNRYTLADSSMLAVYQRGYGASALAVRSVSPHWSAGATIGQNSSKFQNIDQSIRLLPGIEYNAYKYSDATSKQLLFRYSAGVRHLSYGDTTVFGKLSETHPVHELVIAPEFRQKWGSVSGAATWSQYLNDLSKNRLDIFTSISWRIVSGLELNLGGYYARQHDQLNIRGGDLTDEERLVRLRELQSGYQFFGNIGLSFTFGSIFQNVVNPRFGRGERMFFSF